MNVRALRIAATTAFQRAASDRAAFVVSTGFYVAVVAMVGSLWRAAADAHHGAIVGYTAAALFWYIAASESATIAINIRLIEDIGNDIADGSVAVEMLRPASVVAQRIAIEIGRATPRLLCCIAAGVVLSLLVVGAPPDLAAASLAIPSLFLAIACNIAGQHVFAGVAFWIRDARSTWFLYQKFVHF